jgi:hypothetical protein
MFSAHSLKPHSFLAWTVWPKQSRFSVYCGFLFDCKSATHYYPCTVGAQSIARAQSIAPRHTTYVINAKKLKFREFLFGKIKKEEFARSIFKKKSVFLPLKWLNEHFSYMTFFSLIQVLPVVYCGGGEISPRVKPNSRSCLEVQPMFPFPWGVMGKIFLENSL